MIAFLILSIIIGLFAAAAGPKTPKPLLLALPLLGFIYIICVLQYTHRLKKEKCKCSESIFRNIMEILAYIYVFLLLLSATLIGMAAFSTNKKQA